MKKFIGVFALMAVATSWAAWEPIEPAYDPEPNMAAQGQLPPCDWRPLYRYINTSNGRHFYTTNWAELGMGNGGFRFETISGLVSVVRCDAAPTKMHRFRRQSDGKHFYSINPAGENLSGFVEEHVELYVGTRDALGGNRMVPLFRYHNSKNDDHFMTNQTRWGMWGRNAPRDYTKKAAIWALSLSPGRLRLSSFDFYDPGGFGLRGFFVSGL